MYECFQVLQPFRWRGWHYGPANCHVANEIDQETGERKRCDCPDFAGSIWVVEVGHPRKAAMLDNRKVRYSIALRPQQYATDDDWVVANTDLLKLTEPPGQMQAEATPPGRRGRPVTVGGK